MSLSHTILAILENQSYSGYDLWKKCSQTNKYYWHTSQQQIYRELAKLEQQGAISSEIIAQEGRPNKKLYYITEKGIETLITWLIQPTKPMAIREELLVKVIASKFLPNSLILQEIERHRQLHSQQLSVYQETEQQNFSDLSQLSFEQKCRYLTLRFGIRYENYNLAWCEEAIALLNEQ